MVILMVIRCKNGDGGGKKKTGGGGGGDLDGGE